MPWKIDTYLDPHQRLEEPVVGRVCGNLATTVGKRETPEVVAARQELPPLLELPWANRTIVRRQDTRLRN